MIAALRSSVSKWARRIYRPSRPALYGIDRKLERYVGAEPGFFIEAGANDGYSQSNTYFLETRRGWRGVLVEGIPELHARCKRLRTRAEVIHCALVSPQYDRPTVTMHYAHLMSMVDGALKSTDAQTRHLGLGMEVQQLTSSYVVEVPARTLESVLDDLPDLPEIDLFSLDVEGYELNVLEGLNLDRYAPRYILVEARFFNEVHAYLSKRYEMAEKLSHHDYLYRRRDVASA